METVKYAFIGLVLLTVAFAAFVVMNGAHPSDASQANAPSQQTGAGAQSGSAGTASGSQAAGGATASGGAVQEVSLTATARGYDKTEIHVKAGVPVHFTFTANGAGCGSQLIIDNVGVNLVSRGSAVDATFTPPTPGNYPYHCGMNMFRGMLVAE